MTSARRTVVLETDALARLTIKLRANELTSSHIHVHIPDFMEPGTVQTYSPSMATYRRLAGQEPGLTLDAGELKKSGVLPKNLPSQDAEEISLLIQQTGERMLASDNKSRNGETTTSLDDLEPVAWVLDFSRKGSSIVRVYQGNAALSLNMTALAGPNPNIVPNDALLFRRVADFLRRAKNHLGEISKIVVRIVKGKLEILFDSATESLKRLFTDVIAGARILGNVVALVLERLKMAYEEIADAIGKLIERIKAIFAWQDILVTKRAFDIMLNNFMDIW